MENPQPFSVSRSTVFKSMFLTASTGWPLWAVLLAGNALMAVGCFGDVRFLILGLMVCLTVFPAAAFFLFINHMFATEMVANFLNHTIERRQSGYLLRIFRPADQNDPEEEGKDWIESGRLMLSDSKIVGRKTISEYEVIFFKDSPLEVLYVPRN